MSSDAAGADSSVLATLLDIEAQEFLLTYWDHKPYLRQGSSDADAASPFQSLLCLEDMDELLVRARCPGSKAELLLFEELSVTTGYATPHMGFACGASIIINHADKVWPSANQMCAGLCKDFRHAFMNLYFTPHQSQTAPPHSDDRDVFILQCHGRKHWRVWPTPHPLATRRPFPEEQAGKDEDRPHLRAEELGPPAVDVTLEPGAVLYIPRGALHVADTTDADTDCALHLTVAIPTADLCNSGVIMNAVSANCFGTRAFREALPLGPLPTRSRVVADRATAAADPPPAASMPPAASLAVRPSEGGGAVRIKLDFAKLGLGPSASSRAPPAAASVKEASGKAAISTPTPAVPGDKSATASSSSSASSGSGSSSGSSGSGTTTPTTVTTSSLEATWRARHRQLWEAMHAAVGWTECRDELSTRMQNHRNAQHAALASVERALMGGFKCGAPEVVSLRPATLLRKVMPLQMITPNGDPRARKVAQATPLPGGPGKHKYIHTPSELLQALEEVAAMELNAEFEVRSLPARHSFMQACAARALMGLGVVVPRVIVPCR